MKRIQKSIAFPSFPETPHDTVTFFPHFTQEWNTSQINTSRPKVRNKFQTKKKIVTTSNRAKIRTVARNWFGFLILLSFWTSKSPDVLFLFWSQMMRLYILLYLYGMVILAPPFHARGFQSPVTEVDRFFFFKSKSKSFWREEKDHKDKVSRNLKKNAEMNSSIFERTPTWHEKMISPTWFGVHPSFVLSCSLEFFNTTGEKYFPLALSILRTYLYFSSENFY